MLQRQRVIGASLDVSWVVVLQLGPVDWHSPGYAMGFLILLT